MSDEEKKEEQATEEPKASSSKGSMMKNIILGIVGLVIVAGAAVGTMMIMGGEKSEVASSGQEMENKEQASYDDDNNHEDKESNNANKSKHKNNSHDSAEEPEFSDAFDFDDLPSEEELLAELESPGGALDNIKNTLEFLDFEPGDNELGGEKEGMSVEDSLEEVDWLEAEKKILAQRETDVAKREKEQQVLERKLSKQITRIEQAESSRISALAKLYDGMEPRSIAKLIANLDDNTVVSIIPRMKQKNASTVLGMMPPKRAAKLSKQMITISDK